jgi:hypothetical protein
LCGFDRSSGKEILTNGDKKWRMAHHTVLTPFKFMQEVRQIRQLDQDKPRYTNPLHLYFKIQNTQPGYSICKKSAIFIPGLQILQSLRCKSGSPYLKEESVRFVVHQGMPHK